MMPFHVLALLSGMPFPHTALLTCLSSPVTSQVHHHLLNNLVNLSHVSMWYVVQEHITFLHGIYLSLLLFNYQCDYLYT